MKQTPKTAADFIQDFREGIAKNTAMLAQVNPSEFVVTCSGMTIAFDMVDNVAVRSHVCGTLYAPRFTRAMAERLARPVRNGAGVYAIAERYADVLQKTIDSFHATIAALEKLEKKCELCHENPASANGFCSACAGGEL